jgi:transcriptional regulator with XRE-family HTH domain
MTQQRYEVSGDAAVALADGYSPTRVFRTDAGLTIGLLAAQTGLSIDRINRIELGAAPRIDELLALGKALQVPAHLLFDE